MVVMIDSIVLKKPTKFADDSNYFRVSFARYKF